MVRGLLEFLVARGFPEGGEPEPLSVGGRWGELGVFSWRSSYKYTPSMHCPALVLSLVHAGRLYIVSAARLISLTRRAPQISFSHLWSKWDDWGSVTEKNMFLCASLFTPRKSQISKLTDKPEGSFTWPDCFDLSLNFSAKHNRSWIAFSWPHRYE